MLRDKYFFVMVGTRAILVRYLVIITTMVISSGKDFTGRFVTQAPARVRNP